MGTQDNWRFMGHNIKRIGGGGRFIVLDPIKKTLQGKMMNNIYRGLYNDIFLKNWIGYVCAGCSRQRRKTLWYNNFWQNFLFCFFCFPPTHFFLFMNHAKEITNHLAKWKLSLLAIKTKFGWENWNQQQIDEKQLGKVHGWRNIIYTRPTKKKGSVRYNKNGTRVNETKDEIFKISSLNEFNWNGRGESLILYNCYAFWSNPFLLPIKVKYF